MLRLAFAIATGTMIVSAALAQLSGSVRVLDSDKLMIGDVRVLLYGIDAIERGQVCTIDGQPWACWEVAVRGLEILVDEGEVSCMETGEADPFMRRWAICRVNERDINESMVRQGLAVANRAQSDAYVASEEAAKSEGLGIWRGKFVMPAEFRDRRQ